MISCDRDEIHLWRDAALGAHGIELVTGQCFEHRYRAHFHDEFVVAVFIGGAQRYRVGRHIGVSMPGSLLIIPQGETHTGEAASRNEGWSYRAFYPDRETLDELAGDLFVRRRGGTIAFDTAPSHQDDEFARCLATQHKFLEHEADPLARQQAFASAMVALLARYARPSRAIQATGRESQAIQRAVDCANVCFRESGLSVTQLAYAAGLSAYHFMRCFRATTGLTAHQYVLQLRLREARRLLARDLPPSEVACTVGFADQSHLYRHFRAAFGLTPGLYAQATRQRKIGKKVST